MKFQELELSGAYCVEPVCLKDSRGFFARVWCEKEFRDFHLSAHCTQCNISFNYNKATVRGMHYQRSPYEEAKLIRCTSGAIYDVIVDLRHDSKTYLQWVGVELSDVNRKMLFIPEGFAHGYQTLTDNVEVFYQVSHEYTPQAEGGVRWDDPIIGIKWPFKEKVTISEKDKKWPLLKESPIITKL